MKDKQPQRYGRSAEPILGARRPKDTKADAKPGRKSSKKSAPPGPHEGGAPKGGAHKGGAHKGEVRSEARHTSKPNAKPSPKQGGAPHRQGQGQTGRKAAAGLQSRYLALTILEAVMRDQTSLDSAIPDALADERFVDLAPRDKALARLLAMTVLRRHASLDAVVSTFLSKPLAANAQRIRLILLIGTAELVLLGIAPHAAISTAVELTRLSAKTQHFDRLANAILRRVSETGADVYAKHDTPAANIPDWMIEGWRTAYGSDAADRIAATSLEEAALDITVADAPIEWAARLEAIVLPTGSLRRVAGGRIEDLPGYSDGGWWVQDAAAALPAKLLGARTGARILDLCAAPGGKTAQLCAAGADVTAVDVSLSRIDRLRANLDRLGFDARTVAADATTWRDMEPFDGVLIDAPCSATGTIRRHPDILHLKRRNDIARLTEMQLRLLQNAATLVAVGGTLVYCTCSLEPAEGEACIEQFLAKHKTGRVRFTRQAITAADVGGQADWITPAGDLRTLPFQLPGENPALAGIDGFYAARLKREA